MDILSLDPSKSATGWARYKIGDARPVFGHFRSGGPETSRPEMITKFARELHALIAFRPDLVVYERPLRGDAQSNEDNNRNANSLAAVIELYSKAAGIRVADHDNNTWKASFFNTDMPKRVRGDLGKMVRNPTYDPKKISLAMCKAYGFDTDNHNEADALGLLDHAFLTERVSTPWRMENLLMSPVRL